ncbi:septum site-determining protein Ssd [Rhodococcus sp. X156]|uniref:septum site-determining protein Ssd n=1 Tax=Rhodococcus sp. X156 TaxID=2499145 RepID=UPI000FD9D5A6|nr:septum site-determining protein Ssd [Rhodococcus sp. X156]
MTTTAPRILALLSAESLQEEALRLAAAAGCELELCLDPGGARLSWGSAPLVLLDDRAAQGCVVTGLPRRPGVVVLGEGPVGDEPWRSAVAVGAEHVVTLPEGERFLVHLMSEQQETSAGAGLVVAVLGGRGGAGASVLAAAVATAAVAEAHRCLLVDCDRLGGGLDLVLGAEDRAGLRWSGVALTGGRVAAGALREALPSADARGLLTVLSCGRQESVPSAEAVAAVVDAGARGGEVVVCDLPRDPGPVTAAVLDRADLAVLVVPAEVRACAAAAALVQALGAHGAGLQLVVRGPAPGGLRAVDVGQALGLPLLTTMRPQPGLGAALERGGLSETRRSPLFSAARQVLAALETAGGRGWAA